MKKTFIIFFISIFIFPLTIIAKGISGGEISSLIKDWLNERNIQADLSILSEIKYPQCDNILITNISENHSLIKVSCLSENKWSFIVRNKISKIKKIRIKNKKNKKGKANILPQQEAIFLKNSMRKGDIIKPEDIYLTTTKKTKNTLYITDKSKVIGRKLKKSLQSGKPLTFSLLEKNWMIEKDSNISIENSIGGITINVKGLALENADYMQKIKVMNVSSGEILIGFVENRKKVTLKAKQF